MDMIDLMFKCYTAWIARWQLIMEEERESEEDFDGLIWAVFSKKYAMPTNPTERRRVRSDRRFNAMKKEANGYYDTLKEYCEYKLEK